jgi:hypothetical protein
MVALIDDGDVHVGTGKPVRHRQSTKSGPDDNYAMRHDATLPQGGACHGHSQISFFEFPRDAPPGPAGDFVARRVNRRV